MSAGASHAAVRKRRDYRPLGVTIAVVSVLAIGLLVEFMPGRGVEAPPASRAKNTGMRDGFAGLQEASADVRPEEVPAAENPQANGDTSAEQLTKEINALLRSAEKSIREKRYDEAIATLNRAGPMNPEHAPTYLTMGHALAGKHNYALARRYYEAAINFDPLYADAYFAHAAASEQLGDLETALGGMRSFLHTVKNPDPFRLQVAQARSAIWEWEAQLGRGPWGPTRGVPPGFTAAELRRDGKGMGTKMPIPDTADANGASRYEIKTSDKFNLFKP